MPIAFTCSGCAKRYEVSDSLAGKRGRCKQCGTEFQIPVPRILTPQPAPPPTPAPQPTPPSVPAATPRFEVFEGDEALDDTSPAAPYGLDQDSDAFPGPEHDEDEALSTLGPRQQIKAKKSARGGGFEALKNPFVAIVGVGGTVLLLFLAIIVWPSMQGGGDAADAANPNGNAVANAAGGVNTADPNGFPKLPPVPAAILPDDQQKLPVGDLSQHERTWRKMISLLDRLTNALAGVHDAASLRAIPSQNQGIPQEIQQLQQEMATHRRLNAYEERVLARRLEGEMTRVVDRLREQTQRITQIPGLGPAGMKMQQGITIMSAGIQPMLQAARSRPKPYVEVFVANVPDQSSSDSLASKLRSLADGQASGSQATWSGSAGASAFRIWPVANAQNFAGRIDFGKATVQDRKITIQANPEAVAALKVEHEEAESKRAAELAASRPPEDPQAPPDADAITKALVQLQSSNPFKQRESLTKLARIRPDESRADEVIKAIEPLAASTDNSTVHDAIKALANWDHPDVAAILIQVVRTSDDSGVRRDAEKQLGRLQDPAGAEVIAERLKDDWPDSVDALRALGSAAEPAVIPLLRSADSRTRSLACEVLRDIGGQTTLDTMKKLPTDPDLGVRRAANQTMMAIANRVHPQTDTPSTAATDQQ